MYDFTIKKLKDVVLSKGKPHDDYIEFRYKGITVEYHPHTGSRRSEGLPIEAIFPESMRVYRHRILHSRELLLETKWSRIIRFRPGWEQNIQQILDAK